MMKALLSPLTKKKFIFLYVFYFLCASLIVRSANGVASIYWMNIYRPSDFTSFASILAYLKELRTGIPPVLSLIEISSYLLCGNMQLIEVWLYRLSFMLAFFLPIVLQRESFSIQLVKTGFALLLLAGAVVVHKGNPQVYDILYPLWILLSCYSLQKYSYSARKTNRYLYLFATGFFLSMLELLRPFALLILSVCLPLLVLHILFRGKSYKELLVLFIPLLVFSASWHVKLFSLNNEQILLSNNSGNSLIRAWEMQIIEISGKYFLVSSDLSAYPLPGYKKIQRPGSGRWEDLNSEANTRNNQIVRKQLMRHILANPGRTLSIASKRIRSLLNPPTELYNYKPKGHLMKIYRFLSRILLLFLLANIAIFVFSFFKDGWAYSDRKFPLVFLSINAVMSIFLLAIGDAGEGSRFFISILPLLLAHPLDTKTSTLN